MALEFADLANPQQLTTALAFLIVAFLTIIAYIGYRLRNPVIFVMWFLTIVVMVFTFVTTLSFMWFWIMIILDALTIAIVSTVRYLL